MAHASRSPHRIDQPLLFVYIYISSAAHLMSHTDLIALLDESRMYNATRGITGILLYKDGHFMQLLEGAEAQVRMLVRHIARDPRHMHMTPLREGFEEERHYPDWAMAFPDLDSEAVRSLPGYSPFLNIPLTKEAFAAESTNAQKLLLAFKAYIRVSR